MFSAHYPGYYGPDIKRRTFFAASLTSTGLSDVSSTSSGPGLPMAMYSSGVFYQMKETRPFTFQLNFDYKFMILNIFLLKIKVATVE